MVPDQRKIARQFRDLSHADVVELLDSPFHECRLTGLFILVGQFERAKDDAARKEVYDLYFQKMDRINIGIWWTPQLTR